MTSRFVLIQEQLHVDYLLWISMCGIVSLSISIIISCDINLKLILQLSAMFTCWHGKGVKLGNQA